MDDIQTKIDPRLSELATHGFQFMDEPDFRSLPAAEQIDQGLQSIVEGVTTLFEESRLEDETSSVLWQVINVFHRRIERAEKDLDANELEQRRLQMEQDGSEIKSTELEDATTSGQNLVETRNVFEVIRDQLADMYQVHTGSTWRPAGGRQVNHTVMTSAMLDSNDFMAARAKADQQLNGAQGTLIGFAGTKDFNDIDAVENALNAVLKKYPDMVLLHTGAKSGADKIAAAWATKNKVTHIPFEPEWDRLGRTAPFKRNDQIIAAKPKGLIVTPLNGITKNIAQKAEANAIAVHLLRAS